jgi:ABC-2 type transport system permease protein
MERSIWSGELRAQRALFVREARTTFAYKPAVVIAMLTVSLGFLVPMLVWRHVYAARGEALAVPSSYLFPYLLLAACMNFCLFLGIESRIGQRIRMGLIATDLLRPVDFQLAQLSQALAGVGLNLLLVAPFVLLAFALWGSAALPSSLMAFAAFLLSALLSLLIHFALCFLFVQTAFITFSNYGVFVARNALQQTFSGVSAPLVLFPDGLRAWAEWMPFRHTVHTPVSIYLGALSGSALWQALAAQLAWAVGLFFLGRATLALSLRHLEIQGG